MPEYDWKNVAYFRVKDGEGIICKTCASNPNLRLTMKVESEAEAVTPEEAKGKTVHCDFCDRIISVKF